jgi:hypothetical protein
MALSTVYLSITVSNHPNRNWRQRLNTAADQWMASNEAQLMANLPQGPGALSARLRLAYLAGLRDGEGREIDLMELDKK